MQIINKPMFCCFPTEDSCSLAGLHAVSQLYKGYDSRNDQPTFCVFAHLHAGGNLYFIAGIEKTNRVMRENKRNGEGGGGERK